MEKRRRIQPPARDFDDFFGEIEDFNKQMHRIMDEMMRDPGFENLERELARQMNAQMKNAKIEPGKPIVYGFTLNIGPDGKADFQQFGNVKQGRVSEAREPMVEVLNHKDVVQLVAEVPGVERKDVKIDVEPKLVHIKVDVPENKFEKTVALPSEVDPASAKASLRNGVLEIDLKKLAAKAGKRTIKVE